MEKIFVQLSNEITVAIETSYSKAEKVEHDKILFPFFDDYSKAKDSAITIFVTPKIRSIEFLRSKYKKKSVLLDDSATIAKLYNAMSIAMKPVEISAQEYFDYFCD